jgi:hypothetical protein
MNECESEVRTSDVHRAGCGGAKNACGSVGADPAPDRVREMIEKTSDAT